MDWSRGYAHYVFRSKPATRPPVPRRHRVAGRSTSYLPVHLQLTGHRFLTRITPFVAATNHCQTVPAQLFRPGKPLPRALEAPFKGPFFLGSAEKSSNRFYAARWSYRWF